MALTGADAGVVVPAAGALGALGQRDRHGEALELLALVALAFALGHGDLGDNAQGGQIGLGEVHGLEPLEGGSGEGEGQSGVGALLDALLTAGQLQSLVHIVPQGNDVYRAYRPGRLQENYRYYAPKGHDVYRNYRPGRQQENYRYYAPKKHDVYRNFRPGGRSGGQGFGGRRNIWGQFLYAKGTYESDDPLSPEDAEGSGIGLMFGWDFVYSDNFLWGLTAGYAQSSVDQGTDTTDVTDLRFGAYFSRQKDFLSVDGIMMIGLQSYDKKRITTLPLKTFEHTASFNGTSIEAALNVGYDLHQIPMRAGDWSFRPYMGATIIQMSQDAYREKGESDLNLSVREAKDTSLILSPGIIAGFVAAETNFLFFKPEYIFFDLRYEHYLTGGSASTKAYFSADTLQTAFDSPDNEETSAFSIGIGINGRLSDKTRLNFLISNRTGSNSSVQSISASVIHSF